jgi:hypothetical protein
MKEQTANEPYLGDLEKTGNIYALVKTPHADRNAAWQKSLLENLAQASFRAGDPQVIKGPDGFPYFQLFLPEPGQSFQCFVIEKMKDDFLLQSGFGVVINPTSSQVDWVLSYGDVLNFHLNKQFYTIEDTPFSKAHTDEVIAKEEKILTGQPAENILPALTRKLLSNLLKANGIAEPKVLLMMRHAEDGGVSQDLVFNITPHSFAHEALYKSVMRSISWYLPRHYSFVGMDEKTLGDGFMPL